ncbi:MAG TPA: DNA polymerase, partial [Thermoanaerobaculaceae bacterium]|nr:DNA polymerase [Thermoanaerobaculaceae bacterium]
DKDLMQLVADPLVTMWHTRLERLLDERGVEEVFGVPPARVGEVLALMGDASDNIPGCKGIGEKTAKALIAAWGSVDAVYAHLDEVTPPRARKALAEHRGEVDLSRELVRIRTDLALATDLAALERRPADVPRLAELYRRLGFTSLLAETEPRPAAPAAASVAARSAGLGELGALLAQPGAALAHAGGRLAVATATETVIVEAPEAELAAAAAPGLARVWCHDAKVLIAALRDAGVAEPPVPRDAMLAGYLLAPGESADLASICRRLGVEPPATADPEEEARAVARLAPVLERRLREEQLEGVFATLELPLVPVLEGMERHGIRLDPGALAELSQRLGASLAELEREIHADAGEPFNVNSPQQLAEVLFGRRGLPVLRRTAKTRVPSTDADVLAELAARGHRLPALLLEYREQAKLKSTYVDALPKQVGPDGRVHTRFNQAVAATGRLSSSDPNLQNIPARTEMGREVRRAFVAEPGQLLIAVDYSQIELRILAHLSGDPTLADAFDRGEDIHRATAALVFGVAPELVIPEQRRAAKTINFGLIYGMGAYALARELGVGNAEAQRFIDAYFARLP